MAVPGVFGFLVHFQITHQVFQDAQVVEGVNFAGNRLRQGAHTGTTQGIAWQKTRLRVCFVQVLDDGHGLRQSMAVVLQHGDQAIGGHIGKWRGFVLATRNVHWQVFKTQAFEVQRNAHSVRG